MLSGIVESSRTTSGAMETIRLMDRIMCANEGREQDGLRFPPSRPSYHRSSARASPFALMSNMRAEEGCLFFF
jgi:peptidase E